MFKLDLEKAEEPEIKLPTSARPLSVQFSRSVVSDSLRPHELQHARTPCPDSVSPLLKWASQVTLMVKNLLANARDVRDMNFIPGSGISPGRGHGDLLQCSCLENSHGQRNLASYST